MVRFPGGAFLVGSASAYDASELRARDKVVLVLLQRRLGVLGFLRDEEKALSFQMLKYWAKFAHTACLVPQHIWAVHPLSAGPTDQLLRDPNGGKLPHWPHYNKEKCVQMDFTTSTGVKLKEEMAFR